MPQKMIHTAEACLVVLVLVLVDPKNLLLHWISKKRDISGIEVVLVVGGKGRFFVKSFWCQTQLGFLS